MTEEPTLKRPAKGARHCRFYGFVQTGPEVMDGHPVCARGLSPTNLEVFQKCLPQPTVACECRLELTPEEIREQERERAAIMVRLFKVSDALPEAAPGDCGTIPCPACETGTVRWARPLNRGALRASCTTPGCCSIG